MVNGHLMVGYAAIHYLLLIHNTQITIHVISAQSYRAQHRSEMELLNDSVWICRQTFFTGVASIGLFSALNFFSL